MAVSGMPEDTKRCPDCKETLQYNAGTRSYLHVLRGGCSAFGATWRHGETIPRPKPQDTKTLRRLDSTTRRDRMGAA